MLGGKSADIRADGVAKVLKLRNRPEAKRTQLRSFRALTVNTEAKSYTKLVDLHALISGSANLQSPLMLPMLDVELEAIKQQPLATDIPSHTQWGSQAKAIVGGAGD